MAILKTEKFILKPLKKGDEENIVRNANNRKIWINITEVFPHPYTLKEAKKWIKECNKKENKKTHFGIVVDEKLCGCISFSLKKGSFRKTASVGYWLGEEYWGKGIMSEALKLIVDYASHNFNIVRLEAGVFEWNPASARVLEKNGFVLEGRLRKNIFKDGKIIDEFLYAKVKN